MDTFISSRCKEGSSGEKQLGQRVVKDLTQHLKGEYVYFDNFFTSQQLLSDLAEDVCGTALKDRRGFPPALNTAKLKNRSVQLCVYPSVCLRACMCRWVYR